MWAFLLNLLNQGNKFLLSVEDVSVLHSRRDKFADKKVFGHSLVIGGSHGLTGALVLASQAALKVGAGLVTAATWEPQYKEFMDRLIPEVMTGYIPLDTNMWPRLIRDLNKYSSIVIGPGLAKSTRARRLVLEVLNNFDGPVVLDADAINVLSLKRRCESFFYEKCTNGFNSSLWRILSFL
jgi:NAD(P)H-hydrate repair Nnr-like enzyme with NAD(P)H-hydrate dehydratase domain